MPPAALRTACDEAAVRLGPSLVEEEVVALEGVEFVTLRPVADTESTRLADADRDLATFCFGLPATRAVGLTTSSAPLLARRCSPLRISPTSNLGLGRAAEPRRCCAACWCASAGHRQWQGRTRP